MSTKKRDTVTFAATTGANPSPGGNAQANQPLQILGRTKNTNYGSTHAILYSPTKRWLTSNGAQLTAQRTATRCYVRGVKEVISLVPNDPSTWWWRRVVFAFKGQIGPATPFNKVTAAQVNPNDVTYRWLYDLTGDTVASATDYNKILDALYGVIFKGTFGTDWTLPNNARLDPTRIQVLSDKRVTLSSGNDEPRPRVFPRWHPINKTVVYDDDENANTISPSNLSTATKQGLGDVYILDLITCPTPVQPDPTNANATGMYVSMENTTYWHEK